MQHGEVCNTYQTIYQNDECYQTLYMGGAHRANTFSTFDDEYDHDTGSDDSQGSRAPRLHPHGSDAPQLRAESSQTISRTQRSGALKLHLHGSDAPQLHLESEPERIKQMTALLRL